MFEKIQIWNHQYTKYSQSITSALCHFKWLTEKKAFSSMSWLAKGNVPQTLGMDKQLGYKCENRCKNRGFTRASAGIFSFSNAISADQWVSQPLSISTCSFSVLQTFDVFIMYDTLNGCGIKCHRTINMASEINDLKKFGAMLLFLFPKKIASDILPDDSSLCVLVGCIWAVCHQINWKQLTIFLAALKK